MTLVVSYIEDGEVYLYSDTLVSFSKQLGKPGFHVLKILMLSPTLVIAFSGAYQQALEVFFELIKQESPSQLSVRDLAHLLHLRCASISEELGQEVSPDFLLAKSGPEPIVYRITDQEFKACPQHGWIGNSEAAANVFRTPERNRTGIGRAMRAAVFNAEFDDVGGHFVEARGTAKGFRFIPKLELTSPMYPLSEGWSTVNFGTAETGGFGFTTITPVEAGQNGFGAFFFQGRFGFFFFVNKEKGICETLTAKAGSAENFIEALELEVGFKVEHCGSLG